MAAGCDVLVSCVAPADVQPADWPVVQQGADIAATATSAVSATSTAADHVVATSARAVAKRNLSVPFSTPTDKPPAKTSLLKGTDEAPAATATFGA